MTRRLITRRPTATIPQLLICLCLLSCEFPATLAQQADNEAFFRNHVGPIFAERCIKCHQGSDAKAKLTTRAAAIQGGESGPALVAGRPDASLLMEYVTGSPPEMPSRETQNLPAFVVLPDARG